MSKKIPERFYVARVYRSEGEVLAFIVPADNVETKTFQTAKDRADTWASRKAYGTVKQLESIFVDNTPKTGFRIVTNVSRYSTSNVVWRIMHPEGFEFEITSDNMCDLLDTNTIVEGEFQDPLFLTSGKKLVNEKTKLFSDMVEKEEKKKEHAEKSKELSAGQVINIITPATYKKEEFSTQYVYCGKFHALTVNKNKPYVQSEKSTLRFVIKDISTSIYKCLSKLPDDFEALDTVEEVSREVVISEFNEQIRSGTAPFKKYYEEGYVYSELLPILLNDKIFKSSDLKVQFKPIELSKITEINSTAIIVHDGYRIFGFTLETNTNYGKQFQVSTNADHYLVHGYTISNLLGHSFSEYQENGDLKLNISLDEHVDLGYRNNVFRTDRSSLAGSLTRRPVPHEVQLGYYTL